MIPYLHRTGRKRKRPRKFKPGFDRTSGLYGRFRKRRKTNSSELKFYDMEISTQTLGTGGAFLPKTPGPSTNTSTIIDIVQGVGASQRIGRKITIKAVHIRLPFEIISIDQTDPISAADLAHNTIRIMMYCDKQCNGEAITAAEILQVNNYSSFRNIENSSRFRVLYDKIKTMNTTAIGSGGNASEESTVNHKDVMVTFSKKLNLPIEYKGTTGAITEIRSNNIGIIVWAKLANRTRLANAGHGRIRIRYTDK